MKIRTRYAPSPTGFFHIGGARTALYNYLYAKHHGGGFIVREEDTDIERNIEKGMESQLHNLSWLQINYDESILNPGDYGPYKQSLKLKKYEELAYKLLNEQKAYRCFCTKEQLDIARKLAEANNLTPKYNRTCLKLTQSEIDEKLQQNTPYVIRLKVEDDSVIEWDDLIRNKIRVPTSSLTDPVILKSNKIAMYNFAVVVDDYDMEITHVLRGEEHISNTPYQILIKHALGYSNQQIQYGHLSIIINDQNKKLSKRDIHLKQFIEDYKKMGYLPISVVNYLALLGWSPTDNVEVMSMDEMISKFEIAHLAKAPAKIDLKKLNWLGNEHIKKMTDKDYLSFIKPYVSSTNPIYEKHSEDILLLLKPQVSYGSQINDLIEDMIDFSNIEDGALDIISELKPEFKIILNELKNQLANISDWSEANAIGLITDIKNITNLNGKKLFMPIRILCTKKVHGPQLAKVIYFYNKENVLKNIAEIEKLL